jgi:hypothetical protein
MVHSETEMIERYSQRQLIELPDSTIIEEDEAADLLRVTVRHWRRMVEMGLTPDPLPIPFGPPRWMLGDIRLWCANGCKKR